MEKEFKKALEEIFDSAKEGAFTEKGFLYETFDDWFQCNSEAKDLLQKYNDLRKENEIQEKEIEFLKSGKVRVVMKTYLCSCGYKNVGFPNDGKCKGCKEKIILPTNPRKH